MDGNGRWAAKRGLPRIAGHRAGAKAVKEAIRGAVDCQVGVLTLYAFSTENWKRPKHEISALFKLLEEYIDTETDELDANGVRLSVVGDLEALPESARKKISACVEKTRHNDKLVLNLALNYGSRAEIIAAARAVAHECAAGRMKPDDVTERVFGEFLYTKGLPDPDLLIRTSGEMRLSNFLLWQVSYAEIYVTKKLWPDFTRKDFKKAVDEYERRERRYGG
jgi:undecaprenyl diphosphate synthase